MVPESHPLNASTDEDKIETLFDVLLYQNGVVAYCDPYKDQTFDGVPLSSGASGFVGIYFYESGKLRQGHLAKEHTFGKIRLPAETGVELYESGALKTIIDHSGLTIDGKSYPWDRWIYFHEDGSIDLAKTK